MSGGHWDYAGFKVHDLLASVADDAESRRRWPKVSAAFAAIGKWAAETEPTMDWDLSGDARIPDDAAFDARSVDTLIKTLLAIGGNPCT